MSSLRAWLSRNTKRVTGAAARSWRWYAGRPLWQRGALALLALALLGGAVFLIQGGSSSQADNQVRAVTVASVASLNGGAGSVSVIGTVRSIAEAQVLAQASGQVMAVRARLGQSVGAGTILAELGNSSESAAVLQAQGAYDAAVAARRITLLQSGNATDSFSEAQLSARESYRSAYTTADGVLSTYVSLFYGGPTSLGPALLINEGPVTNMSQRRQKITNMMDQWHRDLAATDTTDPATLLSSATANTQMLSDFLNDLSLTAAAYTSNASPAQIAALATARTSVSGLLASLSAARDAYNAKKTAAQVGTEQSGTAGAQTASADAAVKQALGSLRAAQATYEKTVVRAPIQGTVNFLPIRIGDYVTSLMHVATVAQNGALEIVSYVSEGDRQNIQVGAKLPVEGGYEGIVTSIAPALDPSTKQIEVHLAVAAGAPLVDGQSVRITLPGAAIASTAQAGPLLLPLTAVKLSASSRVVFTVDTAGRVVAHPVQIGDVAGDRIQVLSGILATDVIVTDARGLADGEKVKVAADSRTAP